MANLGGTHTPGYQYSNALDNVVGMGTGAQQGIFQPGAAPELAGYYSGYKPTMAGNVGIDQSQQQQFRTGQQDLVTQLQNEARGQGVNPAQQQLVAGTNRNLAQQLAAIASQRGNQNPGLMRRSLMLQGGDINQQAAQQAALLRSQQILGAQGALGGVLGQARGQDIGLAESQGRLNQETSLANALAANNAGRFNAGQQSDLARLLQEQYQYGTGIAKSEYDAKRDELLGLNRSNIGAVRSSANQAIGDVVGLGSAIAGGFIPAGGGAAAKAAGAAAGGDGDNSLNDPYGVAQSQSDRGYAHGGVVGLHGPETIEVGEHGPEVVEPTTEPDRSIFVKHLMEMTTHMQGLHNRLHFLESFARQHGYAA